MVIAKKEITYRLIENILMEVRKIEVIETNLIIDEDNIIQDHQSRVVEASSWDEYCKAYQNYNGKEVTFMAKVMKGSSLRANCKISNLKCDKMHLSCNIWQLRDNGEIFVDRRLAYRIVD